MFYALFLGPFFVFYLLASDLLGKRCINTHASLILQFFNSVVSIASFLVLKEEYALSVIMSLIKTGFFHLADISKDICICIRDFFCVIEFLTRSEKYLHVCNCEVGHFLVCGNVKIQLFTLIVTTNK